MAASYRPKRRKRDPSAAQTCLFPHQANDMSSLGFSNFSRSSNPKPLLELLRVKDHELRDQLAKDHPYAFKFNMG